jgi:hypothetical protein
VVWTFSITRPYANPDPLVAPSGREYLTAIQSHHVWRWAQECGVCALWNGSTRGGAPSFVDPHGSLLHPLVIVTTLAFGVLNGAKIALIASFLMGGLAQWWLARVLGLGAAARLTSGALGVAGGHLSTRMELGAFGVVLSTAACALVLPALIRFFQRADGPSIARLAVALASALLAGQGYMQVALMLALPAAIWLLPWSAHPASRLIRGSILAAALALLLASPFIVPFAHFGGQFEKDTDSQFSTAQPLQWIALNLVIDDPKFHASDSLSKLPYVHLNGSFIGWLPVLLAVYGLHAAASRRDRGAALFLATFAFLAMWSAGAQPLRWLTMLPVASIASFAAGVRHPSQMAGLAVPAIIGLAAIGIDHLWNHGWPRLSLAISGKQWTPATISVGSQWVLAPLLVVAVLQVRWFSALWIQASPIPTSVQSVIDNLATPDLAWASTPVGEHFMVEPAIARGLKLADGIRTWRWAGHPPPLPERAASRAGPPAGMSAIGAVGDLPIHAAPGREYAVVTHPDAARTVCRARGTAGDLTVACDLPVDGTLVLMENSWSGWRVAVDGSPAMLETNRWLSVQLAAGSHEVKFRYRPWDVWIGAGFALIALVIVAGLLGGYWWRAEAERSYSAET